MAEQLNNQDPTSPGPDNSTHGQIQSPIPSRPIPHHHAGASSGFALPASNPFTTPGGPSNPFGSSPSPAMTPLGSPAAELEKLSMGVERYARAVEDTGIVGSFSGTVPLPAVAKRRPSHVVQDLSAVSDRGQASGLCPTDHTSENTGLSLSSLKRIITGRRRKQDIDLRDLEANSHGSDAPPVVLVSSTMDTTDSAMGQERDNELAAPRRRGTKGGILSQLLRLQHNEAVAAAASSLPVKRTDSGKRTHKKSKKVFSYRSVSRNNSVSSLKDSAPPSGTTTPRISPRNSTLFEGDKAVHLPTRIDIMKEVDREDSAVTADSRGIQRDIAEILTRQSFMIMMAKAMVLYGAPAHRIEETCVLLSQKLDIDASFALLPGLMTISFSDPETHTSDTRHLKCSQGMDMLKLSQIHGIALEVLRGGVTVEAANRRLEEVALEDPYFPLWLTVLGWVGSSAMVAPLAFNGGWLDMIIAGLCGGVVCMLGIFAGKLPLYGQVFEITSSIVVGFIAKAFGDSVCFSAVALAGVVVLLPGLVLTQAIMELASRNIVSGAVRMFYALMYAFFLGFGLSLGSELWDAVSGGNPLPDASACQHGVNHWWYFIIYPAVSASINIVFNAHPRQWFGMTSVTAVGLVLTLFLKTPPQISAAISAFAVGVSGQLYGRLTGQMSYAPLLSGVLLLVPGSVGVRGMLAIMGNDPAQGFNFALSMISVATSITLGVFCSALAWYPFWRRSTFMNF